MVRNTSGYPRYDLEATQDLSCEFHVVAGGGTVPVELQDTRSTKLGLSCGSRTRNRCLKDIVTKLVHDGAEDCLADILSLVMLGNEHPQQCELRLHRLDKTDDIQKVLDPVKAEPRAGLHRNDEVVAGGETVHRQERQGWGTVEKDVVESIIAVQLTLKLLEGLGILFRVPETVIDGGQLDVGVDERDVWNFGDIGGLAKNRFSIQDQVGDSRGGRGRGSGAEDTAGVGLRIEINHQDAEPQTPQGIGQVDHGAGLADPTFLHGNCYDRRHCEETYISRGEVASRKK